MRDAGTAVGRLSSKESTTAKCLRGRRRDSRIGTHPGTSGGGQLTSASPCRSPEAAAVRTAQRQPGHPQDQVARRAFRSAPKAGVRSESGETCEFRPEREPAQLLIGRSLSSGSSGLVLFGDCVVELRAVVDAKLAEHLAEVVGDCARADKQLRGDLLV